VPHPPSVAPVLPTAGAGVVLRPVDLIAVPYAVRADRGPSTMRVFLPVAALPAPVAATT